MISDQHEWEIKALYSTIQAGGTKTMADKIGSNRLQVNDTFTQFMAAGSSDCTRNYPLRETHPYVAFHNRSRTARNHSWLGVMVQQS